MSSKSCSRSWRKCRTMAWHTWKCPWNFHSIRQISVRGGHSFRCERYGRAIPPRHTATKFRCIFRVRCCAWSWRGVRSFEKLALLSSFRCSLTPLFGLGCEFLNLPIFHRCNQFFSCHRWRVQIGTSVEKRDGQIDKQTFILIGFWFNAFAL